MSYTVIARKYRPKTFDDLIGQKPISETLKNAISMKKIHHAYLFSGPRGVGKTSTARILAKTVNCLHEEPGRPCDKCQNCSEIADGMSMDVVEIDGASNRGIDEIRALKEKINYHPINSAYKIYIIDEVHMLTPEAFNALLKTLEEPPEHIIFMFATTEPHKIPLTVLSRCQRFDFRRITINEITVHLKEICKSEGVTADKEALFLLAKNSDGSMRDAQSALDQLIAYSEGEINVEKVRNMFGLSNTEIYHLFLSYIHKQDVEKGIKFISKIYNQGLDLKLFITSFLDFLRNLFLIANNIEDESILEENESEIVQLKKWTEFFKEDVLDEMIKYLISFLENFRYSTLHKILVEVAFLNLIDISKRISLKFIYNYINSYGAAEGYGKKDQKNGPVLVESGKKSSVPVGSADPSSISSKPKGTEHEDQAENKEGNNEYKDLWDAIVKVVTNEKPRIAAQLKKGELIENKENNLLISLEHVLYFESLNKQRSLVEKIIKEKLNKDYHLKFKLRVPKGEKPQEEEKSDPVIQNVQKVLKAKVVKKEAYS